MTYCNFNAEPDSHRWRHTCTDCGFSKTVAGRTYHYRCDMANPWPIGDLLRRALGWIGLTEARYLAMRGRVRVVGGMNCYLLPVEEVACDCQQRQGRLNVIGRWLYFRLTTTGRKRRKAYVGVD